MFLDFIDEVQFFNIIFLNFGIFKLRKYIHQFSRFQKTETDFFHCFHNSLFFCNLSKIK